MRLLLCSAVFATAIFAAYGFPADLGEPEVPRRNPNGRPVPGGLEKPRPNVHSKPIPQLSDQASQSPSSFIMEAASVVSSELPSAESLAENPNAVVTTSGQGSLEPAHDPILETASNFPAPEAVVQDAIPEIEVSAEAIHLAPVVEPEVLSVDHAAASDAVAAAVAQAPETDIEAPEIAVEVNIDASLEDQNAKAFVPANSGKSRRHAGVEAQSPLRIGDFEDVEADSGMVVPEYPAIQEQMQTNYELSKEEMILMAMEQIHHNRDDPQMQQLHSFRPGGNRPNSNPSPIALSSNTLLGKPQSHQSHFDDREEDEEADAEEEEDSSENDSTVDLRNGESATIVQEQPSVPLGSKTNSKGSGSSSSPDSNSQHPYSSGSRNKPRPYGMDKPSKNRPTLDSGVKNEHFGLPHSSSNDYVQKGEMGLPSDSGTTSYLGFQIPSIKWTSFTDLFPSFWGTMSRQQGMAKSDQSQDSEACVDDDVVPEGVRSPTIQSHALCGATSNCAQACVSHGFASGTCLGPHPTPGCMCRIPNSKEFGLALKPLEESISPEANRVQDLETSVGAPCKKCACMDACKKSGSYAGYCVDKCYCAVPWYTKQV